MVIPDPPHSIGAWISIRRRLLLLTQKQLAARATCSLVMIKKIESDSIRPSRQLAQQLGDALTLPADLIAEFVHVARQERPIEWLPHPRLLVDETGIPSATFNQRFLVPHLPTELIGRNAELRELMNAVRRKRTRVITLLGPPGVGKTHLAVAALQQLAERVTWAGFIDLTPLQKANHVPAAVRTALQLSAHLHKSDSELVAAAIGNTPAVLVFDNCEHVLDVAFFVAQLVQQCGQLVILATSREPLRIQAEQIFTLHPLQVPAERDISELQAEQAQRFSAIAMFVARAQAAQHRFTLSADSVVAVAKLCTMVDGLPLAIELLAPRMATLTPSQLLAEFEAGDLEGRLELMAPAARDAPVRHQSLADAMHWSYQRLTSAEQSLLRQLAVFVGGCTLDAIQAVCMLPAGTSVTQLLTSLVQRSLVHRDPENHRRYRMLVTIHAYALQLLEHLDEAGALRERHAAYYLGLAQPHRLATAQSEASWWAQLDEERENIRAALTWCAAQPDVTRLYQAIIDLEYYWRYTGQLHEALMWVEQALLLDHKHVQVVPALRAQVLLCAADIHYHRADQPTTRQVLAICRPLIESLNDLRLLAELRYREARELDDQRSIPFLQASLDLSQQAGSQRLQATILHDLGGRMRWLGRYDESVTYHRASVALYRAIGEEAGAATGLALLAQTLVQQGAYDAALRSQTESIHMLRQAPQYKMRLAWSLQTLGMIYSSTGAFESARSTYLESYALFQEIGDGSGLAWNPYDRARIELRADQPHLAEPLLRESLQQFERIGDLRAQAWCHCLLGEVALVCATPSEAARRIFSAITLFRDADDLKDSVATLPVIAAIALAQDAAMQAAQILGAEAAARERQGRPLAPADHLRYTRIVDRVRAALNPADFADAWAEGETWLLEQTITRALSILSR